MHGHDRSLAAHRQGIFKLVKLVTSGAQAANLRYEMDWTH